MPKAERAIQLKVFNKHQAYIELFDKRDRLETEIDDIRAKGTKKDDPIMVLLEAKVDALNKVLNDTNTILNLAFEKVTQEERQELSQELVKLVDELGKKIDKHISIDTGELAKHRGYKQYTPRIAVINVCLFLLYAALVALIIPAIAALIIDVHESLNISRPRPRTRTGWFKTGRTETAELTNNLKSWLMNISDLVVQQIPPVRDAATPEDRKILEKGEMEATQLASDSEPQQRPQI